jgi:competence ComEA-like helix-hairpin-helix protein
METGEPEAELELPVEAKTDIEIPVEPLTPVLEAAETPAEELPDWLRAMEAEGGQAEVEVPDQAAEAELAVPVIPGAAVPSQAHATAPDLTDPEAALAWLESLAAKQGVPETELTTQPEDRPSEAPEWVQDAAALTPVELEIPAAAEEAVPVEVEQPVFEAPKEPAPLPEWLEEMASEAEEVVEIPAPVEEIIVPIETAETEPVEIELATEPISPEITPAEQPVDAALAWLESLAAKQGAPQQELVSKPEDRPVDAPAWATKQEIAEPAAVEPAGQESVERGFDEIKEAEAAAEAIIRAAAQTGTLVMPPSEITGVDVPVHKPEPVEPQPEIIEEPTPAAEEPSFVPPPVEIPEWISKAAESPVGEPWTPPQEAAPEEHAEPQVNLNTSGLVDLESLPGIGFIMAQNILNYREEHGQFKSIEDLANVPGVTPELVGEIRDRLTVEEPEVQAAPAAAPITTSGSERELIQQARTAMSGGNQEAALEIYSGLIKKNAAMDDVIYDLNQALRNQPKEPALWQLLGDAYMYSDKLQEALDAYSKAEEFIR